METETKPAPLPAPVSLTLEQAKQVSGAGLVVGTNIKIYGGYPPNPELS